MPRKRTDGEELPRYPPIGDYALIGDCHSAALVCSTGSIDWCCMPRLDRGSVFGRLLGWDGGGRFEIRPTAPQARSSRRYLDDTMVLETAFRGRGGQVRLTDAFVMRPGGRRDPRRELLRVLDGVHGRMRMRIHVAPRFDYGECRPWIRRVAPGLFTAVGGDDGLVIWSDADLQVTGTYDLGCEIEVAAGERVRFAVRHVAPELLDGQPPEAPGGAEVDRRLEETVSWWRRWVAQATFDGPGRRSAMRSAMVLKCLQHAPTGAIAAAATTSLPESPGGTRNWDYRHSWVRDSAFTVRSLAELGFEGEADGFRRFVERTSAGSADELQVVYGMGGERRLVEVELDHLEGYGGARPVRVGNRAYRQFQSDVYGHVLDLAWRWHERGHSPDDDFWRFLVELVDCAARRWEEPDRGIWEVRGPPRHFVHSKVMCWVALDRGLRLAHDSGRRVPTRRWSRVRDAIRSAVEREGYEARRGVFVRSFGSRQMDAALLLLPIVGFVGFDDPRMVRTTDTIRDRLGGHGLIARYSAADGLPGKEGVFVACTFWLAEVLAHQGRGEEARDAFDRAVSTANDLGLFSEEWDPAERMMLGNFPQGLTHLSHIAAAVALDEVGEDDRRAAQFARREGREGGNQRRSSR